MRAYALSAQHTAALRQYELAAQLVETELGASLEAETTALYTAIRSRRLPPVAGRESHDAGDQTAAPKTDDAAPTDRTQHPVVQAPYATTSFVGRVAELADFADLLHRPDCRLLSLLGPGGSGKTRLALETAHTLAAGFDDGVYFIQLHALTTPDQIAGAIVDALGLVTGGQSDPEQAVANFLRHRRALLMLDNFEQVLEGAEMLSRLLAASTILKFLVTTRELLNLQEEWVYPVEGLEQPGDASDLQAAANVEAVQLFVARAQRVHRDFDLARELEGVVRICRLVDGLPLALELAAAWTKTLTCAAIAVAVQQDIDFLAGAARNLPERHRSMRAILDATWRRLSAAESDIFQTLAVFEGGFCPASAAAVAGARSDHLAAFVDKSMLQGAPDGRFQIHGMLRHYAAERLAQSSATHIR